MSTVDLANAKANLSKLVEQAAAGETIRILRRGKAVAQITAVEKPRRPIDLAALEALTSSGSEQADSAGEFIRRMRDQDRY